jgi:hypothetical protein
MPGAGEFPVKRAIDVRIRTTGNEEISVADGSKCEIAKDAGSN